MTKYQPPQGWPSAFLAAAALGLFAACLVAAICVIWSGATFMVACAFGCLVGAVLSAFMLWLFYWRQLTTKEIWQGIGAIWHEFGKY